MRKLHKNSGKNLREFTIGRTLFIFNIAEDPERSFFMRRWSWQNDRFRMETIPFFSLGRVRFYNDNDDGYMQTFRVILGPFKLNVARRAK